MKLLILTQKVDKNDDVLGFMHGWLLEFAKGFEKVTVICLGKGMYDLPDNVSVMSLGKEDGRSRLKYIFNFYRYIWQERNNYDAVFVHMNPEYVILGWLPWRIMGKKISLWYNHLIGGALVELSNIIVDRLFYTSTFAFVSKFMKAKKMPAGIDTEIFKPDQNITKLRDSILSLGRISPVKKVGLMISAIKLLDEKRVNFTFDIYGNATERDTEYFRQIKLDSSRLEARGRVEFYPGVSNMLTPKIYNEHEVFLNATQSGSLDKSILEAMACGCLVLVSNRSFVGQIPESCIFEEDNSSDLANKLESMLLAPEFVKNELRRSLERYVSENHSLSRLVGELYKELND